MTDAACAGTNCASKVVLITEAKYYLVEAWALPEVLCRALEAKKLLSTGEAKSVTEAIETVGISRSAFYKYRSAATPFLEMTSGRIVTLQASLEDVPGVLSRLLNCFADCGASVLTINQNIPLSGSAAVTISIRTDTLSGNMETLLTAARALPGVLTLGVLAAG
ncbi:MAG: ACT domain-containing protein [Clostridiaceae bacterium]|nr:ACT domain-containing protein [Clostridiaceae bacterium]